MTNLTNSLEGGSSGSNIVAASSGGLSGNAFDVISANTGQTCQYDNTHAAHGNLAVKYATGASNVTVFTRWSTSMGSSVAQTWFRFYLYMTANPAAQAAVLLFSTSGGATCGTVRINTGGTVNFNNGAGSSILTSTNSINLNGWTRIEGFIIGSATVGQAELKVFTTPDATSTSDVHTSAANLNTNGVMGLWSYGLVIAQVNFPAFWMDDLGLSNTGYLGPATVNAVALAPPPIPPGMQSPLAFTALRPVTPVPPQLASGFTGNAAASARFRGVNKTGLPLTYYAGLPGPVVKPITLGATGPSDPFTGRAAASGIFAGQKQAPAALNAAAAASGSFAGSDLGGAGFAAQTATAATAAGRKVALGSFTGRAAAKAALAGGFTPPFSVGILTASDTRLGGPS